MLSQAEFETEGSGLATIFGLPPTPHRNRALVEPPQDGTQSCLYHIVAVFVGQNMTEVRRDLGTWYLQPVDQARLFDMLPTNLQNPAQWIR